MAPSWLQFLEQPTDLWCIPFLCHASVQVGLCQGPSSQSGRCVKRPAHGMALTSFWLAYLFLTSALPFQGPHLTSNSVK